jgi:hypothetical protein
MLPLDLDKLRSSVREAETEDLLDRATFFRSGMEADALACVEEELGRRGIDRARMEAHADRIRAKVIWLPDGTAAPCSFCRRPAIARTLGWHRLKGWVPIFPRIFRYCEKHWSSKQA